MDISGSPIIKDNTATQLGNNIRIETATAIDAQDAIKEGTLITAKDYYSENDDILTMESKYKYINVVNSGWASTDGDSRIYRE